MSLASGTKSGKRKHRRLRRALMIASAVALAALATPFVFTGPLVRYWLSHSAYRDLPIHFRSAHLSPTGRLTLYDVAIEDTGEQKGLPLASAGTAEIAFRWADVSAGRLEQLAFKNLDVTLRPGKETPITLLRLLGSTDSGLPSSPAPATAAINAPPASTAGPSLWVDQILVSGVVRLEGFGPQIDASPFPEGRPIPLDLMITSSGASLNWNATVSMVVGNATGNHPRFSSRIALARSSDATTIKLESLALENVPGNLNRKTVPLLPDWMGDSISWHLDNFNLAGSATFGRADSFTLTLDLRDLNGEATANTIPLALDHFAAGMHVEGKIVPEFLNTLSFSHMRCAWQVAQVADWKFEKGIADFAVIGSEIELSDFQSTTVQTEVIATGAIDAATGILSRGRIWLNGFAAPDLMARLPREAREAVPWNLEGDLSARVFLTESDDEHLAAHVELVCPDRLIAFPLSRPGPASTAASQAASETLASVSNLDLSGTVSWSFAPGSTPEVSRGRLTADQLVVVSPHAKSDPDVGIPFSRIKSDFTISAESAVLNDFYADLPGNGRVSLEADYHFADGALEKSSLNLSGIDAALLNPWLPAGWLMAGQLEGDLKFSFSPRVAEWDISLGLAQQTNLSSPDGTLSLTGAPSPSFRGHFLFDRDKRAWNLPTVEIASIATLQVDAGMVKSVKKLLNPPVGAPLDSFLTHVGEGGILSFDRGTFIGTIGANDLLAGNLSVNGLDFGIGADKSPQLLNLFLTAGISLPLAPNLDFSALHMTNADILAEKIILGQNVLTEIFAAVAVENGKITLPSGRFNFAEGSVDGDAAFLLSGRLESLHLNFSAISQQILTRSLYPDVFTAEGPISGNLALLRTNNILAGSASLTADKPGRLKISRQASAATLAPAAKSAAQAAGSLLPENVDEIVINQFTDFPYVTGRAVLRDSPRGLTITLTYTRAPLVPGDPGYGVEAVIAGQQRRISPAFSFDGFSFIIDNSLSGIMRQATSFRDLVLGAPSSTPQRDPN